MTKNKLARSCLRYKLQRRYFRQRSAYLRHAPFGYKLQRRYFRLSLSLLVRSSYSVINSNGDTSDLVIQLDWHGNALVINSNGDTSDFLFKTYKVIVIGYKLQRRYFRRAPSISSKTYKCYKLQRRYFRRAR